MILVIYSLYDDKVMFCKGNQLFSMKFHLTQLFHWSVNDNGKKTETEMGR
jgi:hypothetical protein